MWALGALTPCTVKKPGVTFDSQYTLLLTRVLVYEIHALRRDLSVRPEPYHSLGAHN